MGEPWICSKTRVSIESCVISVTCEWWARCLERRYSRWCSRCNKFCPWPHLPPDCTKRGGPTIPHQGACSLSMIGRKPSSASCPQSIAHRYSWKSGQILVVQQRWVQWKGLLEVLDKLKTSPWSKLCGKAAGISWYKVWQCSSAQDRWGSPNLSAKRRRTAIVLWHSPVFWLSPLFRDLYTWRQFPGALSPVLIPKYWGIALYTRRPAPTQWYKRHSQVSETPNLTFRMLK